MHEIPPLFCIDPVHANRNTSCMARIAIVGPGAIGGVMAAWLTRTGRHSLMVCARTPVSDFTVETPEEDIVVRATTIIDPRDATPVDWVFMATKTYDSPGAAKWLPGLRTANTPVAVLQNGVEHRERFADWVSADRMVPALLYCPAERVAPNRIRQRRAARIDVPDDLLGREFAGLFAGVAVEVTPCADFQTARWRKLSVNCVGALNALLLEPEGIFRDGAVADIARGLAGECVAVARAEGAQLDAGAVDAVLDLYRHNPPDTVNSIHADRLAGRRMEVDARNGVIVRLGRKHGIPTPYNHMAAVLLETLGRRPARPP
jgi:2-dehydropantoate 2-reductase